MQQISVTQRERITTESVEEREGRLRHQLAAESAEEREARLQQMSICQCEQIANETVEDRGTGLQCASEREKRNLFQWRANITTVYNPQFKRR